jgi:hypothetical protein
LAPPAEPEPPFEALPAGLVADGTGPAALDSIIGGGVDDAELFPEPPPPPPQAAKAPPATAAPDAAAKNWRRLIMWFVIDATSLVRPGAAAESEQFAQPTRHRPPARGRGRRIP